MNPTVDWIWYTAICHNNVNAGLMRAISLHNFKITRENILKDALRLISQKTGV